MTHVPHGLSADFPADADRLHDLRQRDAHFARLCDEYDEINRALHRAETDIEPTDDLHMTEMRKQRMLLKDRIARYLSQPAAG